MNILSSVKVLHKTALFGSAKGVCFGQQLDDTGYFPSAAVVPLETLLNEWGESKEMEMFISTLAL